MAIEPKNDTDIKVDSIGEKTGAAGIDIENDTTFLTQLLTDTIAERVAGAGITADGVLLKDNFVQYLDVVAPADPSTPGWRLYSDTSDTELKARDDAGVVVNLSGLRVKYTTADGGVDSTVGTVDLITQAITAESDELIIGYGELSCSQAIAGFQIGSSIRIDGAVGKELVETGHGSNTGGNRHFITPIHVRTGLTGSIDILLQMRRLNGGTAHTSTSRLHIFQLKFRS